MWIVMSFMSVPITRWNSVNSNNMLFRESKKHRILCIWGIHIVFPFWIHVRKVIVPCWSLPLPVDGDLVFFLCIIMIHLQLCLGADGKKASSLYKWFCILCASLWSRCVYWSNIVSCQDIKTAGTFDRTMQGLSSSKREQPAFTFFSERNVILMI